MTPRLDSEITINGASLSPLQRPIVNLNGNTREQLIEHCRHVMDSARDLDRALAQANEIGHGRNYQTMPQGNVVASLMRDAIGDRRRVVLALVHEFEQLALDIQKGGE
jgi:hypothetical protein